LILELKLVKGLFYTTYMILIFNYLWM